jgi:hypothetical protein
MKLGELPFEAGMRCLVFDPSLYIDDVKTPLSVTMKLATVLRRYFYEESEVMQRLFGPFKPRKKNFYDEVIDVRFDYNGKESKAHFVWAVEHV